MMRKITYYLSVLLMFVFVLPIFAQKFNEDDIKKDLPKMIGANNVGREFYFSFIPCWETAGKNEIRIYISSTVKTKVTLTVKDKNYSETKFTIPNDIIQFILPSAIGQPYRKTDRDIPEPDKVWEGAAIHIVADDPIICYGMTRFQYTSDGFMALPVNALDKEYIVSSYADPTPNTSQYLPSYTSISAAYNKTKVRFTMGGNDWSKTAGGTLPGETTTWDMNAGDVLLIASLGAHADLSGSKIQATKPVAVVSGNFCAYIPTDCGCCDVIEEMELPTSSWGTEYHVTKIQGRKKNSIIKIYAKEKETTIYRDYLQIGYIRTAGGVEGAGYLHFRADSSAPRPIVISGDKPISVTQYNTGQTDDGVSSDPFQLVLTPIEQYQKEIIFNTPGIKDGFGYPANFVNICYEATDEGRIPNDFEFATVEAGQFTWQKMADISPDPGEPFAKKDGGKNYYSKALLLPGDGVYKLKSDKPFAAYAYGFSSWDSYGFPASASSKDVSIRDVLPPEPVWSMDSEGNVNVAIKHNVTDKPDNPELRSNLGIIYIHTDISYNYKLTYDNYMPRQDASTPWKLEIENKDKDALAVVTFTDCAGNDTTLIIEHKTTSVDEYNNHKDLFTLYDIMPNPVTSNEAIISFELYKNNLPVSLEIFNTANKLISKPIDKILSQGIYNIKIKTKDLASGMYYYIIKVNNYIESKKLVILK